MRGSKAGGPRRPGGGSNVISIVEEIERRRAAQVRSQASAMHLRELESSIEVIDHTDRLKKMDFAAELAELDELPPAQARLPRAELRAARALQSCFNGDPDAGHAEWAEVVAEVPEVAHTYLVRARWLMQSDPAAALADYDRAAAVEPGNPAAYWRRGDCYVALGDPDRALANYLRAVALDGSLFDVHHAVAKIFAARGDHAEAVAAWDRAIAHAPRYVDFYLGRAQSLTQLKDFVGAARDQARIVELDPNRHDARFYRAICLHQAGQTDVAIEEMLRLVDLEPGDAHNHRLLGKMLLEKGRRAEAVAALTRASELAPGEWLSFAHRGRAHFELGEHALSAADFRKALALQPQDPELHLGLAKAQAGLGDLDEAITTTEAALALAPDHAIAHLMRAVYVFARRGHPAFEEVKADLDRAVEIEPDNPLFLRRRGEHLLEHGLYRAALPDFERALTLTPGAPTSPASAPLLYGRGYCKSRLLDDDTGQDPDEWYEEDEIVTLARCRAAIADLEQAISLGLCTDDLYTELWNAHCQLNDDAGQAASLDRGCAARPESALLFYLRHGHRQRRGDEEGAAADRVQAQALGFRFNDD